MKAYKIFDKDLKCREFQYEIGETFTHDGEIELCSSGFHFCKNPVDLFNYYGFDSSNRVCEIEIPDDVNVICGEDKCVTNQLTVVSELDWYTVLELINAGKNNTGIDNSGHYNSGYKNSGHKNSGDHNSGDHNSGHYNSGHYNSGYKNSGHKNSGYQNSGNYNSGHKNSGHHNSGHKNSGDRNSGGYNSGDYNSGYQNSGYQNSGHKNSGDHNSGDHNSGDHNSGDHNSGHYNSGHWNSCNYSSGLFNSTDDYMRIFNQQTDITWEQFLSDDKFELIRQIIFNSLSLNQWISYEEMTEEQKEDNLSAKTQGGFLLTYSYKEACQLWWDNISEEDKQELVNWEWFDADVFFEITGIQVKGE